MIGRECRVPSAVRANELSENVRKGGKRGMDVEFGLGFKALADKLVDIRMGGCSADRA